MSSGRRVSARPSGYAHGRPDKVLILFLYAFIIEMKAIFAVSLLLSSVVCFEKYNYRLSGADWTMG